MLSFQTKIVKQLNIWNDRMGKINSGEYLVGSGFHIGPSFHDTKNPNDAQNFLR
jgi:hypothetical protein